MDVERSVVYDRQGRDYQQIENASKQRRAGILTSPSVATLR